MGHLRTKLARRATRHPRPHRPTALSHARTADDRSSKDSRVSKSAKVVLVAFRPRRLLSHQSFHVTSDTHPLGVFQQQVAQRSTHLSSADAEVFAISRGTLEVPVNYLAEETMALVRSNFEFIRVVRAFPAPLCEKCNEPMGVNGAYTPNVYGRLAIKHEYLCRECGTELVVWRSKAFD